MAVPLLALGEDPTGGDVQGGEQRRRADRAILRWTGAIPPFLPPGSAMRGRLMCIDRAIAWEGRSRLIIPGGLFL